MCYDFACVLCKSVYSINSTACALFFATSTHKIRVEYECIRCTGDDVNKVLRIVATKRDPCTILEKMASLSKTIDVGYLYYGQPYLDGELTEATQKDIANLLINGGYLIDKEEQTRYHGTVQYYNRLFVVPFSDVIDHALPGYSSTLKLNAMKG